jgi:hypothetical protein
MARKQPPEEARAFLKTGINPNPGLQMPGRRNKIKNQNTNPILVRREGAELGPTPGPRGSPGPAPPSNNQSHVIRAGKATAGGGRGPGNPPYLGSTP